MPYRYHKENKGTLIFTSLIWIALSVLRFLQADTFSTQCLHGFVFIFHFIVVIALVLGGFIKVDENELIICKVFRLPRRVSIDGVLEVTIRKKKKRKMLLIHSSSETHKIFDIYESSLEEIKEHIEVNMHKGETDAEIRH